MPYLGTGEQLDLRRVKGAGSGTLLSVLLCANIDFLRNAAELAESDCETQAGSELGEA